MPGYTHPEDGMVYACPHCDHAGMLYQRETDKKDADFRCGKCSDTFNTPVERESRHDKPENPDEDDTPDPDDGIPNNLDPDMKRIIREKRNEDGDPPTPAP